MLKDLDVVRIPREVAVVNAVEDVGTVVWCSVDAPFATVEVQALPGGTENVETKLIDVEISRLVVLTEGD
jgi:hypothetical protein